MGDRLVVIGVGNRDRGDDGVGPFVCDVVARLAPERVSCTIVEGSTIDLPVRWAPADDVVIVDAASPAGTPGAVTIDDPASARLVPPATWSTHAVDVGAAVELARVLGRLPAQLRIVGIEGERFDHGAPMTPVVARSADAVARLIATWAGPRPSIGVVEPTRSVGAVAG
jgi:hydrogenase maturation protease